jgi:Uma2 family endonuclease
VPTGGDDWRSPDHSQVATDLIAALRARSKGRSYRPFGDNAGVAAIGETVRYPDASVTFFTWEGVDRASRPA